MGSIRKLSPSVVNRIAAGEVVERPASVVKELLENAIDAGPTRVDVAVEQGGIALVRVVDDGCGIDPDDLPLAVENHATSKLRDADDLAEVATFGFRGEALASIGEVSRLVIRSRRAERPSGASIEIDAGSVGPVIACSGAVGTIVEAHQLFARIPARRAFLRTAATEWTHVADAFLRTALAHPAVAFSLSHNGKKVHDLPAVERWIDRIAAIHGTLLAERLLPARAEDDGIVVEGWVGRPEDDVASGRLQHLFVNDRPFRDRSILHAVQEAYRGLLLTGRQPVVFIRIALDPSRVDVNVHPAKVEVRFREPSKLHQLVLSAVRTALVSNDVTARLRPPSPAASPAGAAGPSLPFRPFADPFPAFSPAFRPPSFTGMPRAEASSAASVRGPSAGVVQQQLQEPRQEHHQGPRREDRPLAVQMHDRYIVLETVEGIEVIDQHALHERVIFARLRASVATDGVEAQRLLVPEPVEVSGAEAGLLAEHAALLDRVGLSIEPFGGNGVAVTSRPAVSGRIPAAILVREVIERLENAGGTAPERLLDDVLHGLACRAAIKAGDRLSSDEVAALVRDRTIVEDGHHCPHGRPTTLKLSRQELDRQFRRT